MLGPRAKNDGIMMGQMTRDAMGFQLLVAQHLICGPKRNVCWGKSASNMQKPNLASNKAEPIYNRQRGTKGTKKKSQTVQCGFPSQENANLKQIA